MAEVIILQMSDICISSVSHAPFSFTINTIKYKIQTVIVNNLRTLMA
jgi:hypothetical protein